MSVYDLYENYRSRELSAQEQALVADAGDDASALTQAHIRIACARAQAQLAGHPVMPEDENVSIRFPGVDPVGCFSLLDLKAAQRFARLDAWLQTCPPETAAFRAQVQKTAAPALKKLRGAFLADAASHRVLTRASKLCLDGDGSRQLHLRARELESGPAAVACELYLQGMEYSAGIRRPPLPPDVEAFYARTLGCPIPSSVLEAGGAFRPPERLSVPFADFGHRLAQIRFSDPRNWGRSQAELDRLPPQPEEVAAAVPAYAAATAARVLDAAFRRAEPQADRADLLRVDGLTVRERLARDGLDRPTPQQLRDGAALCVAAALLANRSVEARLPGADGTLSREAVPVQRSGYAPGREDGVIRTAFEDFSSKQGLYARPKPQAHTPPPHTVL